MESPIAIEGRIRKLLHDQKQLMDTLAQAEARLSELKAHLKRKNTNTHIRKQQVKVAMSFGVSCRRACALVGISRTCLEKDSASSVSELSIIKEIRRLHEIYPEYGIRRIRALLSAQGFPASKYRCEKIWQEIRPQDNAEKSRRAQKIDEKSIRNISMISLASYFHGLATSA